MRYSVLTAILLIAFLVPVFSALAQDASLANANQLINDTGNTSSIAGAVGNSTEAEVSSAAAAQTSVQGIWKVEMREEEIIMALNQSGESIFGLAKFEGSNPWNGAVAGSFAGDELSLSLAATESDVLASTYMNGAVEGDSINGGFVRSDSNGKTTRGKFTATMISPDTFSYTPAMIEIASKPAQETQQSMASQDNEATESAKLPAVQETTSKYKDVKQLAKGINPNIMPRMAPL